MYECVCMCVYVCHVKLVTLHYKLILACSLCICTYMYVCIHTLQCNTPYAWDMNHQKMTKRKSPLRRICLSALRCVSFVVLCELQHSVHV